MNDHEKLDQVLRMLLALASGRSYSLAELSDRFGLSIRTIQRYISTFRRVGFVVERHEGMYRIPKLPNPLKSLDELLHFSEEEAYILTQAIHSIDDTNLLKSNLVKKLYSLYNFDRVAETVVKPGNTRVVHILMQAIRDKKQVLLRQYRSSHGKLVRDRLVEPFDFTTNYQCVWAYDREDRQCKLFKTSRIGKAEALDKGYEFETMHEKEPVDVFRMSSKDKTRVVLNLSLRAFNLLSEEYPLAEKYVTALDDNHWQLSTEVCGFEGVGRFVLGLCDEMEIVEPEELKQFIKDKIKNCELVK